MVLLGLALLLAGNWVLPLIDRDEPRFAEASREMRERHDFIVPHFNGEYRFDKPPLIYWCQAGAFAALGENAFAARLPSALFATGTALLLLFWGGRLGRPRTGLFAALMFVSCLQVLIHGRLAVADMPMIFFFTLAVWSGWEMTRTEAKKQWWWIFHGSLGFGFLAKGPEAYLPLAGLWIGRWRRRQSFQYDGVGMIKGALLSVAIIGAWAAPALVMTHGEFLRVGIGKHVIHRSFGVMEGHGLSGWLGYVALWPLYFLTFFASFFPWSIWAPGEFRRGWSEAWGDDLRWFLLVQAALVFGVFTLAATKLPHYTLPAFPCLALWLAFRMDDRRIFRGVAIQGCVMMVALGAFFWFDAHLLAGNLWRAAAGRIYSTTRVASVDFEEPSLVWEFRQASTNNVRFIGLGEAQRFWRGPGARCLIVPTRDWDMGDYVPMKNMVVKRVTGTDTASFRRWDVVIMTKY